MQSTFSHENQPFVYLFSLQSDRTFRSENEHRSNSFYLRMCRRHVVGCFTSCTISHNAIEALWSNRRLSFYLQHLPWRYGEICSLYRITVDTHTSWKFYIRHRDKLEYFYESVCVHFENDLYSLPQVLFVDVMDVLADQQTHLTMF